MWDFLKHLKEILSLDYRSLFIVSAVSWAIVLLPMPLWQEIGLATLWLQVRPWAFGIGVIFTTWFIFGGLYDLAKGNVDKLNNWMGTKKREKKNNDLMKSLSRVEKEILARYVAEDTTTIAFDFRDGVVNGLISKGILYRASQGSNPFTHDFDVNLQAWVSRYLIDHPDLLEDVEPNKDGRHHIRF